ncbi:N-acetylglucosamine kinase [Bogoriella caseilytica]|uniref:N-acetylglucosamine kinase-like BadF-type ATPase n=1 Tax=Bogoriella caseilytica TaxID=56055 RepID=A0A3N2BD16_9MICO|nr:BadF/BadG/BcrA/BcrD ATPase family protein [Bogoriella caseilytica]ROR73122.1 N-acetylglucosamine kinase-like BadF-type ATPase [Bogoriella caseilytica]
MPEAIHLPASRDQVRHAGIDVGGTKTHLAWSGPGLGEHEVIVPTRQWARTSALQDPANLVHLAALVRNLAGDLRGASVVVGLHGGDTAEQREAARRSLSGHLAAEVDVVNDAQLLGPAAGVGPCISVIAGTGAIVVGVDSTGGILTADGYGWLISDLGSAPAIARDAVIRVLRHADRHHPQAALADPLGRALSEALGAGDTFELAASFSEQPSAAEWGALAPVVFDAALAGSVLAHEVIDRSGHALADGVHAVLQRGAVATSVVAAGGVITNQPLLEQSLRRALESKEPRLPLHVLREPPVRGALALAKRL